MSFIDTRINSRYRFGFVGGPEWRTLIVPLQSGAERRKALWALPHHRYTADYATLTAAEKESLLNTFIVCRGAFSTFRFLDWNDYTATNESLGTGDNTSTARQLTKTYTFGASSYVRNITLPYDVTVTANGSPIAVTVDPITGLVTPDAPWPNGQAIAWSGKFDVKVRFANDFNPFTSAAQQVREVSVELVEVIE